MKLSTKDAFIFTAPAMFLVLLVFIYPVCRTTIMAFFAVKEAISPMAQWAFVGLSNFKELAKTPLFIISMTNITKIWIGCGIAVIFLAFIFSIALTQDLIGKKTFRAIVYLPNVIASIAVGYMWLFYVYNNQFGLLKSLFSFFNCPKLAEIQWLDSKHIFVSMCIASTFGNVGYYMMMFIAAIEKIPADYYEEASIEGSGVFHTFFHITVPLIKSVMITSLVLWTSRTMGFFALSQVFIGVKTYTPMLFTYMSLFGTELSDTSNNAGLAAASAVIMTLIVVGLSSVIQRLVRSENYGI